MTTAPLRVFVSDQAVFGDSINRRTSTRAVVFVNGIEFTSCPPVSREDARRINEAVSALKGSTHAD